MIVVPRGKIIKIAQNGIDILDNKIQLTLDSEVTINLQSTFTQLISNAGSNKLLQVLGSITNETMNFGFSGAFKEMGYQMWSGSEPIQFTFTTTLNMKISGKTDVLDPAKILMKLPLPQEAKEGEGFGLIAPGPSILGSLLKKEDGIKTKNYSIRIGALYMPSIVVTKAEPTFSTEIDENGYPTWCTISMDVSGLYTATTGQIDQFGLENDKDEDWTYE